jgi:hypothetical protein
MQTQELFLLHYDYVRKWRFGFTLGGHIADYSITNSKKPMSDGNPLMAEVTTPGVGFDINGLVDYRLVRNWHLRSGFGICFGQREVNFYHNDALVLTSKYDSYYLEIPLTLKYSANRHSNFRPYVLAGTAARYNLGGQVSLEKNALVSVRPLEPFYEAGFGFDWFFFYFKLSFEIKYSGGFINVWSNRTATADEWRYDGYTPQHFHDAISRMNSRMLLFSFHFE